MKNVGVHASSIEGRDSREMYC